MVCGSTRPVPDNLPPANHLADREEPNNLSDNNTDSSPLFARKVSNPVERIGGLRADRSCLLLGLLKDSTRSDATKKVLEIALESSNVTTYDSQIKGGCRKK